jgi:hypothetical protein
MMVGLIPYGNIIHTAWVPFVHNRTGCAQSTMWRYARWLENDRRGVHALSGPLIHPAQAAWETRGLTLTLDTSMLWDADWLVRISLV